MQRLNFISGLFEDEDGQLLTVEAATMQGNSFGKTPLPEYDEYGLSLDPVGPGPFACCFYLQDVDQYIDHLSRGDEFDQRVAAEAPRVFAIIAPGREGFEPPVYENQDVPITSGERGAMVKEAGELYKLVSLNRDPEAEFRTMKNNFVEFDAFYPDTTVRVSGREKDQPGRGEPADGVLVPVQSFNPLDDYQYAPQAYINNLRTLASKYRNYREGQPYPGQFYGT